MKKISGSPYLAKTIVPVASFAILAFMGITFIAVGELIPFFFVIIPMSAAAIAMQILFFNKLSDEVYDTGDALIFQKGGVEQEVMYDNIEEIKSEIINPQIQRVIVRTKKEGEIGKELSFLPSTTVPVVGIINGDAKEIMQKIKSREGYSEKTTNNYIDSNFAIAILILVVACLCFAFFFLNYSVE